jgi:tetratricopeptide (TPR) repeat protein
MHTEYGVFAFIRFGMTAMLFVCVCGFARAAGAAEVESAADFNTQGVEFYNEGQWADAVQSFRNAYELNPDNGTIRRNLCNAYQSYADALAKQGSLQDAIDNLEVAINVDADNASPYVQLSAYYLRLGQTNQAMFRLEDALQIEPENLDAMDLLGDAYYATNDLAGALSQWLAIQEKQPNRPGLQKKIEKATREEGAETGFKQANSRHFEISFAPETSAADRRKVLTALEQAYRDIGRKLGNAYPEEAVYVLIYTDPSFKAATATGAHVGALFDGKIRAPIMGPDGKLLPEDELKRRLYHEYTHVVIRYLLEDQVPWWLNEGLAETFSRDFNETEREAYLKAADAGKLITVAQLEESQLEKRSTTDLQQAYIEAHATASYLWGKFGQRSLLTLINNLGSGIEFEEAIKQTYRRDYKLLIKEVTAYVRGN